MSSVAVTAISGSLSNPSRTAVLTHALAEAVARRVPADVRYLDFGAMGGTILATPTRPEATAVMRGVLQAVESADILIVGTPVYRGSYTGVLKHLFDLVERTSLTGKIAVLAATGGTPLHGLVTEHQLRPLLSFFATRTVSTAIYALDLDLVDYRIANAEIAKRIEQAADEAVALLAARKAHETLIAA